MNTHVSKNMRMSRQYVADGGNLAEEVIFLLSAPQRPSVSRKLLQTSTRLILTSPTKLIMCPLYGVAQALLPFSLFHILPTVLPSLLGLLSLMKAMVRSRFTLQFVDLCSLLLYFTDSNSG
jgi:hypothetical protein